MKRLSSVGSFEYCPQSNRVDFSKTHGTKITLESQSFKCSRLLVTGTALPPDLLPWGFLYSRRQRHSFTKGFLCHSGRVAEVTQGKQGKPSVCPCLDRRVSWYWAASGCFELEPHSASCFPDFPQGLEVSVREDCFPMVHTAVPQ